MPMGTSFGYEFHFGYEFFYPRVFCTSSLRILTFPTIKTRPKKLAVFNFLFLVRVFGHQFWKTARFFGIWRVLTTTFWNFWNFSQNFKIVAIILKFWKFVFLNLSSFGYEFWNWWVKNSCKKWNFKIIRNLTSFVHEFLIFFEILATILK